MGVVALAGLPVDALGVELLQGGPGRLPQAEGEPPAMQIENGVINYLEPGEEMRLDMRLELAGA